MCLRVRICVNMGVCWMGEGVMGVRAIGVCACVNMGERESV